MHLLKQLVVVVDEVMSKVTPYEFVGEMTNCLIVYGRNEIEMTHALNFA